MRDYERNTPYSTTWRDEAWTLEAHARLPASSLLLDHRLPEPHDILIDWRN